MRKPTWQADLAQFIQANQNTPFAWGTFDCVLFACACVELMTGRNPTAEYVGTYHTEKGAARVLKRFADGTVAGAFNRVFGQMQPRLKLGRGDVALVNTPQGQAAGINLGGQVWLAGQNGLVTMPLCEVLGCWHTDNMQEVS